MGNKLIYLVRHGVTSSNKKKIYMGQSDEGLDEEGIKQAHELGMRLKERVISKIYTSPIMRALQTAEILSSHLSTEIIIEDDLREMRLGEWEGLAEEEIKSRYPREWKIWNTRPAELRLQGREPLTSVQERSVAAIRRIITENGNRRVVAVTHVAIIRCLILFFKNLHLNLYKSIDIPNSSIFELEFSPESINVSSAINI
jgi:broad specificity phosphatase PhoE